jgi:hypothetical protein
VPDPSHPFAFKHDPTIPDVLIEFSEHQHKRLDTAHHIAEWVVRSSKIYYGEHAFRSYSWLKGAPRLNKAGNLRGMVLDKRSRALFELSAEGGEALEAAGKALLIAGWVIELAKSKDYIAATLASRDDKLTKAQKISTAISMATVRTLTGAVPLGVHLVAATLAKGARTVHAPGTAASIAAFDGKVKSTYDSWTNPDNVVHYVNTHLVY